MLRPMEWLWTPEVPRTMVDDNARKHGSCVASKAAGTINGVSKRSRLVSVKMSNDLLTVEYAFGLAYDDIVAKGRERHAVILFPHSSVKQYEDKSFDFVPSEWRGIHDIMDTMMLRGINVVVSAGNGGREHPVINTLPALWYRSFGYGGGEELIVVGATTIHGDYADFTQGPRHTYRTSRDGVVWAPGVNIRCARTPGLVEGTSSAAGMVMLRVAIILGI